MSNNDTSDNYITALRQQRLGAQHRQAKGDGQNGGGAAGGVMAVHQQILASAAVNRKLSGAERPVLAGNCLRGLGETRQGGRGRASDRRLPRSALGLGSAP